MIKTRLFWFTVGFASASATMAQFVFRDLRADRQKHFYEVKEKFSALDTRVANLEKVFFQNNSNSNVPAGGSNLK